MTESVVGAGDEAKARRALDVVIDSLPSKQMSRLTVFTANGVIGIIAARLTVSVSSRRVGTVVQRACQTRIITYAIVLRSPMVGNFIPRRYLKVYYETAQSFGRSRREVWDEAGHLG
jgi:hypothetical protein